MMSVACLMYAVAAIAIKYHLKNENWRFEREDMSGGQTIKGSKAGHGWDAIVSFRE